MKTAKQILKEEGCTLQSYIVKYIDTGGIECEISLLANNEDEAKAHCRYIYKDSVTVISARKGSLMQKYY